jgi:hypothetical protein
MAKHVAESATIDQPKSTSKEVQAVIDAWNNAGPVPSYHHRAQADLFRTWPTLAVAVKNLADRGRDNSRDS